MKAAAPGRRGRCGSRAPTACLRRCSSRACTRPVGGAARAGGHDGGGPRGLARGARLDGVGALGHAARGDIGDVMGLLVEHVRKLGDCPDCVTLTMKQLGKSRVSSPCSVEAPSAHLSDSAVPPRPCSSKPARRSKPVPTSKPVAKIRQSSGYSRPSTTAPAGVMRSTPRPAVSTSVTLARLNMSR